MMDPPLFNFVIWNVGQGSWNTYIHYDQCIHIDMGGEIYPRPVESLCRNKKNRIFITHEDWDHISFIGRFRNRMVETCLIPVKKFQKSFLKGTHLCSDFPEDIRLLDRGSTGGDRNSQSLIFLILKKVLISGDAPIAREKIWENRIKDKINLLVLGHHGSNTSTSVSLLKKTKPNMAVASARKEKYGHPHFNVVRKLRNQKVPLIRTDVWGTLYFRI